MENFKTVTYVTLIFLLLATIPGCAGSGFMFRTDTSIESPPRTSPSQPHYEYDAVDPRNKEQVLVAGIREGEA